MRTGLLMSGNMCSRLINSGINCTVHIHNDTLSMWGKQHEAMDPSSMVTFVYTSFLDEMKTFTGMKRKKASIKRSTHT